MRSDVSSCSVLKIEAMDFPDLSDMDLEYWNGDLKLGKTWAFHSTIFWIGVFFSRRCIEVENGWVAA